MAETMKIYIGIQSGKLLHNYEIGPDLEIINISMVSATKFRGGI